MYVGMRMSFVGRGNEKGNGEGGIGKGRTWNDENGLCWERGIRKAEHGMMRMDYAGRGESERQNRNENGRTRNDSLPLTVLISSRD
jgi:hypothetical protein